MSWNYAELSKTAKNLGGPENYADTLTEYGRHTGHMEMLPLVGVVLGLGVIGGAGIQKFITNFRKNRENSKKAAQQARDKLIQDIQDYDNSQTDNGDMCPEFSKEDAADDKNN
jgi:hypothetical protein